MKALIRPELFEMGFLVSFLGIFLISAVFVRLKSESRAPVAVVQEKQERSAPALSSFANVPPPRKAGVKRKVAPRKSEPKEEEMPWVRAQPLNPSWGR